MYETGQGTAVDEQAAMEWYHRAAIGGETDGLLIVAQHYELGKGVPNDEAKKRQYIKASAALGNEAAIQANNLFRI